MACHSRSLAVVLFLSVTGAWGCGNTAEGVKRDAAEAQEKASEAQEKAAEATKDVAREAGRAVDEAGASVADGARVAAARAGQAIGNAGDAISGAAEAIDVKAALMADKTVDASHIVVKTDSGEKTVTLQGTVPLASQKTAAEVIATTSAPGYRIVNKLEVVAGAYRPQR